MEIYVWQLDCFNVLLNQVEMKRHFMLIDEGETTHFSCSRTSNRTFFMQSRTSNRNILMQSRTLNIAFLMQHLFGFKIMQISFLTLIRKNIFLAIGNDFLCTFKKDYEKQSCCWWVPLKDNNIFFWTQLIPIILQYFLDVIAFPLQYCKNYSIKSFGKCQRSFYKLCNIKKFSPPKH